MRRMRIRCGLYADYMRIHLLLAFLMILTCVNGCRGGDVLLLNVLNEINPLILE